jgi:hypothetical protein
MSQAGGTEVSGETRSPQRPRPQSWPETWMRAVLDLASVSPERHAVVLSDIEIGSQPTLTYYVLLGISELIAGFALIIGSDATLIGANVVAPLMTPIIGISLGLMHGDLRLLRRESGWAVRAEVVAPRVLAPNEVHNVEDRTAKAIGESVDLAVRARTDILVTGKQYQAVGDVRLTEEGNGVPTPEARSP